MALIAYRADSGERIESFTLSPEQWALLRNKPIGTFVIGRDRFSAIPTRSRHGLQYCAHAPGRSATSEPESVEHEMAKLEIVRTLRANGYRADPEYSRATPTGNTWEADVLVEARRRKIAFEVQLSSQHFDEYRSRTDRYLTRKGTLHPATSSCGEALHG